MTASDPYADARTESMSRTVSVPELAGMLNFSVAHTYELARRGELPVPSPKYGGRYLIKRSDVDHYFGEPGAAEGRSPTPAPLTLVAQERSEQDRALAAIDRRIADHENEVALWQSLRSLLVERANEQRAAS